MRRTASRNTCVRNVRNEAQILRCQKRMIELAAPVGRLSSQLTLAGNEVRMKILLLLAEEHSLCVCDLSEILGMTIPAVSQHLKKLREGGLVFTEQNGVTIYYHLSATAKPLLDTVFLLLGASVGQRQNPLTVKEG